MMKELEQSRQTVVEALAGVTEQQATHTPGVAKWSILDIVEHLAVSEMGMLRALGSAQPVETSLDDPEKASTLFSRISGRAQAAEAPDIAKPTGRFPSLEQALAAFVANRQATIEFATENEARLHFLLVKHPVFGACSGYELLLIMAGHALRHAKQIWESRS